VTGGTLRFLMKAGDIQPASLDAAVPHIQLMQVAPSLAPAERAVRTAAAEQQTVVCA
jgi:hypothetical protein